MPSLRRPFGVRPLVSLILCTKDGMPFVTEALASVECQTYENLELVLQDAVSTDGTLDAIDAAAIRVKHVVSRPDGGIGDAYNLAIGRCSGAIVGTIDADNLLEPDAVERAVGIFREHRDVAAVYGAARMIDERGAELRQFVPAPFDLDALLRCELVPPFAQSFFSREVCGPELRFDPRLKTCADFDLWLRLSRLPILRTETIIGSVRLSDKSMTRSAANYEQFCADKLAALDWFVARNPELAPRRDDAAAGVYCWAVESLLHLEGPSARAETMLERALSAAPAYERAHRARTTLDEAIAAAATGEPNS